MTASAFSLGANAVSIETWAYSATMTSLNPAMFVEKSNVNAMWEFFDAAGNLELRGGSGTSVNSGPNMANSTWECTAGTITGTSGAVYL